MSPDEHARMQAIFQEAVDLPTEQRNAYLDEACRGDAELRVRVQRLLTADQNTATMGGLFVPFPEDEAQGSDRHSPAMAGMQLAGRYLLQSEIGRGGFGVVFLALDQQLHGRKVVVKLLLVDVLAGAWHRKKFRQEVEALSRLNHPGIVLVTDAGEAPGERPFLVMEYVPGVSLRSVMQTGAMDFRQASSIIRQIGSALQAAHECGVWHRDLKPENILVQTLDNSEERVKVIDFGIATVVRAGDRTESVATNIAGTFRYMAPEQLKGKPEAASDIHALAVVAYEWITGRIPFQAESAIQLHALQAAGALVRPRILQPELSEKAEQILLKALSFLPRDRPASVRDFSYELALALEQSARSTPQRGPAHNLGSLVVKMCNRRSQEDEFKSLFLSNSMSSGSRAQMYILHGEEGACHESLVERLAYQVQMLAGDAGGEERPQVKLKRIPWQYAGDLASRKRHLFAWLIEQLGSPQRLQTADASPAALGRLLVGQLASFVLLQHDIRATRWDEVAQPLIQSYREFLAELPASPGMPQLVVFLNVIYPSLPKTPLSPMNFMRTLARRRIQGHLRQLATEPEGRRMCPCTVLSELAPITRDDVLEWFSLHDIGDSEEDRLARSERIFPRGKSGLRRMAEVEVFLRETHHAFVSERGYR
jgi:serine/threonine protein kinase